MKFILQTIDKKITMDQCFQMERCKEYYDWKGDPFEIIYGHLDNFWFDELTDLVKLGRFNPKEWCPVGSVEFVEKYLKTFFGENCADNAIKPMNIPDIMFQRGRSKRDIIFNLDLINNHEKLSDTTEYFIKDNDRIKNQHNGIMTIGKAFALGMSNIQVQEVIKNIDSEWRVFIHNGLPVDIKNYSGSPFLFPDLRYIDKCSKILFDHIKEGTIDFGIANINGRKETFIIECHKFFSVGLYGFSDNLFLPLMFWRTYKNLIDKF